MKDYYKILEVQPHASLEVINNAYRALVRQYHPDLFHRRDKTRMNAKMQEINEAYNILSTPETRAQYDRGYRAHPFPQATSTPKGLDLKKMLIWAVASFLVFKVLLQPLFSSPIMRFLFLGVSLYLIFKLSVRGKSKPPKP